MGDLPSNGPKDIIEIIPLESRVSSNGHSEKDNVFDGRIAEITLVVNEDPSRKIHWYQKAVLLGAYVAATYGLLAMGRSVMFSSIGEEIAPAKAYRVAISTPSDLFNIFSTDRITYDTTRNFDNPLRNKDFLETVKDGIKRSITDMDADGKVDMVEISDGSSSRTLVSAMEGPEIKREFEQANIQLAKVRQDYKRLIEDVEERAMFGM